ncbi:hypothetical protein AAC387_Pa01g2638 [Persea americana]
MLPTAAEDARTPKQPGNTGVETSIVPWEASESTPERPEWLPKGWEMKVMTIKNGTTDGVKDWVMGRKGTKEVQKYEERGRLVL